MMTKLMAWSLPALAALTLATATVPAAAAPSAAQALNPARADQIRRAIDERRLLDAGRLIDQTLREGVTDRRVSLLTGELGLASARYELALRDFQAAAADPALAGQSLQGQGLALINLGRTIEAKPLLEQAVAADQSSWRAWNALGSLYDSDKNWARADTAYANALAATDKPGVVLNNRGYSRMLQGAYDLAVADFVTALEKRPDLSQARTNLRLALALQGEYERATAGMRPDERSALLNNAGFAAGLRGDYGKAQELLKQAMQERGEYFDRANANLKWVEEMASRTQASR
jgi:Flp pilus assembly protein TadD